MVIQTRPDNQVFASGAKPGEVALFPDILRGWGITLEQTEGKPPLEWMNGVMQRFDKGIQYALQRGIPEWHKTTDYPAYAVVQHAGLFYVSVQSNAGTTPGTDAEKWGVFWDGIPRLKVYKTLPLTNEGDIHLIGSGAHTWSSQNNRYIPIKQPAKRVGMLETFFSRQHLQKEGGTPRDGQLVPRALFPDFVREYLDNGVLPCAPNDAAWLADTSLRTQWVANDGNGNFRVPDWNGKQSGSVAVYGGRGDGTKSNGEHGKIQLDQMQRITGLISGDGFYGAAMGANGPDVGALRKKRTPGSGTEMGRGNVAYDIELDSALSPNARTGDETRVIAPTVVWGVYLSNSTDTKLSPAQVDMLVGQYSVLNAQLQTLNNQIDFTIIYPGGGHEAAPGNISTNTRYVTPNPFSGNYVICFAQVRYNGVWGDTGQIFIAGSGLAGGGVKAYPYGDNIVTQVGDSQTLPFSAHGLNPHGITIGMNTPYPCRVLVWKIKGNI